MFEVQNPWLLTAAVLNALAAVMHVGIVFGGPAWYRFFGAGERFAQAAEQGRWFAAIVTLGIAGVLAIWSAYALSGAGLIAPLPFLKPVLITVTAIYGLRALGGFGILAKPASSSDHSRSFMVWSSLICAGFGAAHLVGVLQMA
jgi:hypothetical protein